MVEQRFKGADKSIIDGEISSQIFDRNRKLIIGQVSVMSDMSCNLSRVNMWKVKQKVCPAIETMCPVAKMNKDGELISNRNDLKILYAETYKEKLRHRTINPNYAQLKMLKENLFSLRIKLATQKPTVP